MTQMGRQLSPQRSFVFSISRLAEVHLVSLPFCSKVFTSTQKRRPDVCSWLTLGAIMFGDPLLPSECSLIIEELKATSLCFQCAHGRPTTVPIVNVASLRGELARLGAVNGRQEETWHGLSHHGPSLERARTRLRELRKLRGGL
jgi:hypothetical protein